MKKHSHLWNGKISSDDQGTYKIITAIGPSLVDWDLKQIKFYKYKKKKSSSCIYRRSEVTRTCINSVDNNRLGYFLSRGSLFSLYKYFDNISYLWSGKNDRFSKILEHEGKRWSGIWQGIGTVQNDEAVV